MPLILTKKPACGRGVIAKRDQCHIYIEPEEVQHYGILDLKNAQKVFEAGYNTTLKILQDMG